MCVNDDFPNIGHAKISEHTVYPALDPGIMISLEPRGHHNNTLFTCSAIWV